MTTTTTATRGNGTQTKTTAPTRQPRMTLASICKTPRSDPMRILLYSVEKGGKTTFAAHAPAPIFICPEDGIPPGLGAVSHFPAPADGWTWQDARDAVRALTTGEHSYKTLVVDTVDWLEPLLWRDICEKANVATLEEVGGGYGKGFTAAVDGWRCFLSDLEQLRKARGMHVVLLAHSWIKNFKDPESEGWDRYILKTNEKAAGVLKEWVDAVLFAKFEEFANKDARTKRVRGISSGERVIYTTRSAAYDAGNRYSLPDRIPLDWDAFEEAVKAGRPADPAALRAAISEAIADIALNPNVDVADIALKVNASVIAAGEDAAELSRIHNKLAAMVSQKEEVSNVG